MKCKICDGTGTSNICINGTFKPCAFCDGTGEYEPFDTDIELDKLYPTIQTNEEWIKSMNTEQLAKRLHNNDVYAFFVCKHGGKVPSVESYVEWLKQPHRNE